MLTIGKAGKLTGLSASAVRYYERQGLIRPSRLPSGYRHYDEDAIRALRFIRRAQALGITLREIRQLLELTRRGERPCDGIRELARRHLREIDSRMRELQSLRTELRHLLSRRAALRTDEICPLIASDAN